MHLGESIVAWKDDSKANNASTFLLLLIAGDFAFVVLHLIFTANIMDNPLLSLEKDRGAAEFYQYIKEFWIAILLLVAFKKTRTIGFGMWALLFMYLLLDDALSIHEKVGGLIAGHIDFTARLGFGPQHLGELVVSAVAGAVLLSALILPYLHGSTTYRQISRHLFSLLLALAFFGVFIDALHVIVPWEGLYSFFGILEDGGEMVVMSVVVWYVYLLNAVDHTTEMVPDARQEHHAGSPLHHLPV